MRSTSLFTANISNFSIGKLKNKSILRPNVTNASRNARPITSGSPVTPAGSATPQCAVIGCPGHTGQTSAAAESQTVNTKSIRGAPPFANSSQLLLRNPSVESPANFSCSNAKGFTRPAG